MQTVYQLILLFTIYSFVGWACETAYCSIPAKRFINRGFLNGPFCPVYGFGALLVIYPLEPLSDHIVLLFLCGMIITSLLEYLTAYILEVCFHTKWWDYSQKKFNIHGRVCLKNSLLFGVMSVLLVKLLHPWVQWLLTLLPDWLVPLVSFFLLVYFVTDSVVTVRSILTLNGKMEKLQQAMQELKEKNQALKTRMQQDLEARLDAKLDEESKKRLENLSEHIHEMTENSRMWQRRLLEAFPHMSSERHAEALEKMRQAVQERREKRKRRKK